MLYYAGLVSSFHWDVLLADGILSGDSRKQHGSFSDWAPQSHRTLSWAGQGVPVSVKEAVLRDVQRLWGDLKAGEDGVYPTGGKAGPAQPTVSDSAQDKQTMLCQAVGRPARLSQWIRTGQLKSLSQAIYPSEKGQLWNMTCKKLEWSINSRKEHLIFRHKFNQHSGMVNQ